MRTSSLLLVLLVATFVVAQTTLGVDDQGVYHNPEMGFSFTTPDGLRDVTKHANVEANKDPNTVQLLLFELSGPNSAELKWRGVAVQSFYRSKISAPNDFDAEVKLSRTIIGKATETASPRKIVIGDLPFSLCEFQRVHGAVTEYTHVYATIVHEQVVAFAFTANSLATLDSMAESLKTLKLTPGKPAIQ